MAQPQPPNTRQSGPEAHTSPDPLHKLKPGGPIKTVQQFYQNPGPTKNLRGIEPNTEMHRGAPNPEQHGSPGKTVDHNPGPNSDPRGHGVPAVHQVLKRVPGRHSEVSTTVGPATPGDFARGGDETRD